MILDLRENELENPGVGGLTVTRIKDNPFKTKEGEVEQKEPM